MRKVVFLCFFLSVSLLSNAQSDSLSMDTVQMLMDEIESKFRHQTGSIELPNGIGTVSVPKGYTFLDSADARMVLEVLWGNPEDHSVLGLLVPENAKFSNGDAFAFIITYDEMGYVEDDDADDIDYDELIEQLKTDAKTENEQRASAGFETIEIVGWAATPFYDADKKVLHWAKEIKFGEAEENTLNYNIRILGRKGVMVFNAVGGMDQLPAIEKDIQPLLASFEFSDGNKYSDFDPEIDEVAAWTVGGLVAGKVLAKAGFFAIILKNIKLIGLGLVAVFGGAWKWFRKKVQPEPVRTLPGEESKDEPTNS